jgi:hypothetical protein
MKDQSPRLKEGLVVVKGLCQALKRNQDKAKM